MLPRSAKKGAPSPATRKTARAVRSTPKAAQVPPDAQPESPLKEENVVDLERKVVDYRVQQNGGPNATESGSVKEAFEEEDRGERLDFDDNELEYEAEEDQVLEYDDREDDYGDGQQEDDEEEAIEGQIIEEEEEEELEEGDVVDEEDGGEEEGAEEDENADEEEGHEDVVEHKVHHDVVKERRKRKEFEVFVGGLEKETTEEDLKKVFGEVGEIIEVRLMKNSLTKKSKGFAFLRFATVEQAKRAVVELKSPVINGKLCGVAPSHDNDTLFIGNISKTWGKETLKEKLKHYGVVEYEDLTLVVDSNNERMNRGFAFLEFASRSDAMVAYKRLQRRDVVFGVDRSAKVSFADSFIEPDDEVMAQVKTIFVDGIPASWDEDHVKEYLKLYGKIEKIELARNMPSAKRKDFGFVTFDTHDAAVTCAEAINNTELGEGTNKVKVRARLSRPHQKGRGNHFVRGDHKIARGSSHPAYGSWSRGLPPRAVPGQVRRGDTLRSLPMSSRMRPIAARDRHSHGALSDRGRILPPPSRAYDRRSTVGAYPKSSSLTREYATREKLHAPRGGRFAADCGPRTLVERHSSYRDEYSSRATSYSDVTQQGVMRPPVRKSYIDEDYGRTLERSHPSYRESRGREFDLMPGSKRPYAILEEDPRYADPRHSRTRLDYGNDYNDAYSARAGRVYDSSRSSLSGHESIYGPRHGVSYGGSGGSGDVGGMYSSSYGGQYMSREHVGGSSYSSLYTSRSAGASGYMDSGGSGSYY